MPNPYPFSAPLELTIECRARKSRRSSTHHKVEINADWSVDTPHDIEAERVAAALGAHCSCVDFVDRAVPALRRSVALLTRRERPRLERDRQGRWQVPETDRLNKCCASDGYASVAAVLNHLRDASHIAHSYGAPLWQLNALLVAATHVWRHQSADGLYSLRYESASLVREVTGATDLWAAGIHPDDIPALAAPARATSESLPVRYFIDMAYGNVEPDWLSAVLPHRPDADTAAWLAALDGPQHSAGAEEWGRWLDFGVSRELVARGVQAGLASDFVSRIAALTGWTIHATAEAVIAFADIDCRPTATHFALLRDFNIERPRPSGRALNELIDQLQSKRSSRAKTADRRPTRTELALMLVILGNKPDVIAAVSRGVRRAADLDPIHARSRKEYL